MAIDLRRMLHLLVLAFMLLTTVAPAAGTVYAQATDPTPEVTAAPSDDQPAAAEVTETPVVDQATDTAPVETATDVPVDVTEAPTEPAVQPTTTQEQAIPSPSPTPSPSPSPTAKATATKKPTEKAQVNAAAVTPALKL